jgi:hypothetical protein
LTERLEVQIRHLTEAVDAQARRVEDLVPEDMAERLGFRPATVEITVPIAAPQRRVPGWVWGLGAAAVVLLLALPLFMGARTSGPDVVNTTAPTTTLPIEDQGLVQYSANGHYYEAVSVPGGITWAEARAAAESRSVGALQGHLATFTSADEYAFVVSNLSEAVTAEPNPFWLGGFQPPQSSNEPGGDWRWVTGEVFGYTNWAPGEPNDSVEGEDCLHPHHSDEDSPAWNDQPCDDDTVTGYVVEYGATG